MYKYNVTIMGSAINRGNQNRKIEAFITINSKKRNKSKECIDLKDILFNPMELFGDLQYISENMSCYKNNGVNIFCAPYSKEPCLKCLQISDPEKYFTLLDILKDIIYNDKNISILDVYQISNYLNIPIWFNLSFQTQKDQDNLDVFKNPEPIYMNYSKNELFTKEYIYVFPCYDLAQIIIAVFTYLVLFNYHFFQCAHCKRYSAEIRHQKNSRYCDRNNILHMPIYENMSCKIAVDKILNSIYKNYGRKQQRLYERIANKDYETSKKREEEYNSFKENYKEKKEAIKNNPSPENILELKTYIDSIVIKKQKSNK